MKKITKKEVDGIKFNEISLKDTTKNKLFKIMIIISLIGRFLIGLIGFIMITGLFIKFVL